MNTSSLGDAPQQRLGRYALLESLGSGGMGEVHRARIFAAAGVVKDLCIKRIRSERLDRPGALDRFITEARLGMRLTHSNIVPVFDFGRTGDEYYLVMEWVDGADMAAILSSVRADDGDAIAPEIAAHVAAEVAWALVYAHEFGGDDGKPIVHRDIKPANVLLSRSGDVKISDFGMAMVAGDAPSGIGGTPGYMAPEQGRGEVPHPATDLFSLGVVLAEMLTGKRPDVGEGERPWEANLPQPLAHLLRSLLQADPGKRPSSAREVANALEEYVGAARASSGRSPREELARLAERGRCSDRKKESGELTLETGFLRDGQEPDFADRMTTHATLPTAATMGEGEGASAERPKSPAAAPARPDARWLLWPGVAGAAVLAAWFMLSPGSPYAPEPTAARVRAHEREAEEPSSSPGVPASGPTSQASEPPQASFASHPDLPQSREPFELREPAAQRTGHAPNHEGSDDRAAPSTPRPARGQTRRARRPSADATRQAKTSRRVAQNPGRRTPAQGPREAGTRRHAKAPAPSSSHAETGSARLPPRAGPTPAISPKVATSPRVEMGTININAVPWAEVYKGTRKLGVTPLFGLRLPVGYHTLRLVNQPLGIRRETRIRVDKDNPKQNVVIELR